MPDFTLPSGKVVQTHEPTFGEYLDVVTTSADDLKELIYAKFALIVPGLTREEVATLPGKDGRALLLEVSRIWEGEPEEAQIPLSNGGQQSFTASSRGKQIQKPLGA
jgi:hypothetical protein